MTYQEFEHLWESDIKAKLTALEGLRKKERKAILSGLAAGILVASSIPLYFWTGFEGVIQFIFVIAFFIGLGVYGLLRPKDYRQKYKDTVIANIIKFTNHGWTFNPANPDTREDFLKSGLYYSFITTFHAEDWLISDNKKISVCEMRAVRGSGKNKQTIFEGLLFRFDLNHSYKGETYIRAEGGWDKALPMGTKESRSLFHSNVKTTDLEWNDFEKLLDVQTTDEIEAREILDPAFMEVLYHWWQNHKKRIRLSFKDGSLFMSIPASSFFEPSPFSSVDSHKKELWTYVDTLLLAESLYSLLEKKYHLAEQISNQVQNVM